MEGAHPLLGLEANLAPANIPRNLAAWPAVEGEESNLSEGGAIGSEASIMVCRTARKQMCWMSCNWLEAMVDASSPMLGGECRSHMGRKYGFGNCDGNLDLRGQTCYEAA